MIKGSRRTSGEKMRTGATLWLKEIGNWLPYSQSPRPYAICGATVYRAMLRLFGTIQSLVISRQLFLTFSVPFLRFVLQCNTMAFV